MSVSKICEVGNHPFTLEQADIEAYQKFGFDPLPICFPHQHQWRLSFRNDRFLHRRICDLTGAEIISMYPQNVPYKVYEREAWFSDKWDPLTYGRPFDFNRPFFEQYAALQKEVPRMALVNVKSENSDYCNSCVGNKNSYLIFGGDYNEDSLYGALPMFCKNCADCDWILRSELCYFCGYSENCYGCRFTFNSKNCTGCAFIEDCIGCNDCILSFNLRNKQYYIENKQYSREEYMKRKEDFFTGSYEGQKKLFEKFLIMRTSRVVKYARIINGQATSGDLIFNSKNCQNSYECTGSEDCRECWTIFDSKDSFNSDYIGQKSNLIFNGISTESMYRATCCYFCGVSSSDFDYCELCLSSKNLLGCIGLQHQQYCILNKQYSKEEFISLRERIIAHMRKTGEWGRYFPKQLSTFPYHESTASIFFPKAKDEAISEGFKWNTEGDMWSRDVRQTYKIPDNIRDVPDSIVDETLACEVTGKNFKIIPQELSFYRQQNIPMPRRHPNQRYRDRLALRNPFTLFDRTCQKCNTPIKTTYMPSRPETVYCERCYLETVD